MNQVIKQPPIIWTGANSRNPVQMNTAGNLRMMMLHLNCQPTLTSGNNTQANTATGDAWGVITRIDVVINGGNTIMSLTGRELFALNLYWFGVRPFISSNLGDAATANPTIDAVLLLPFMSPRATSPLDTNLRTQNLSDIQVAITWGTFTNINTAATAWSTQPTLVITNYQDDTAVVPPLLRTIQKFNAQPTGAVTDFRLNLTANYQYRRLLINTQSGNPFVDDPACISNVQLISGSTYFFDFEVNTMLQGWSLLLGDIQSDILNFETVAGTPPFLAEQMPDWRNTVDNRRAWYNIDLCPTGLLAEAVNSVGLSDFALHFNVLKACQINVIAEQLQLLAPAA